MTTARKVVKAAIVTNKIVVVLVNIDILYMFNLFFRVASTLKKINEHFMKNNSKLEH